MVRYIKTCKKNAVSLLFVAFDIGVVVLFCFVGSNFNGYVQYVGSLALATVTTPHCRSTSTSYNIYIMMSQCTVSIPYTSNINIMHNNIC